MHSRRRFLPILSIVATLAGQAAHASPLTANGTQPVLTHPILPSGNCTICHGDHDPVRNYEPGPTWQGSMMAQSSRDPLFWAALDVANADLPGVGDFCLRCHTTGAWFAGRSEPPAGSTDGCALVGKIDEPGGDFDGINCHFCHRMQENPAPPPGQASKYFDNGQVWLDDGNCGGYGEPCRHGPYDYPADGEPAPHAWAYSPYLTSSDMCASCHNVTNPVKNLIVGGADAGIRFPIERTHREWQLSDYGVPLGPDFLTCQQCHMPDALVSPAWGSSFQLNDHAGNLGVHQFVGGNAWIPEVLKGEYPALGLDGPLESTRLLAIELLQQQSANLTIVTNGAVPEGEPITAMVRVTNLTGHKLPTGYPEGRRMWLHVAARDANDTLVWESGAYDPTTGVLTRDPQAKVYESKQGVWNAGTAACETAAAGRELFHFVLNDCVALDNRIPPKGFTGAGDLQTAPVGYAYPETAPGSGVLANWDTTTYIIPLPSGAVSPITVTATLRYQTASKEYVDFLRDEAVTRGFPDDCIERTTGLPGTSRGELMHDLWAAYDRSPPVDMAQAARVVSVGDPQYPIADTGAFKCQAAVSKAGAKFIGKKAKCVLKCQNNARKGKNPFSDCYPPYGGATAFCVGDVAKGAQTKFAAAIVKGCTKKPTDCPSCYSGGDCSVTGHAAATVANLEGQLDAFTPAVACEETTDKAPAKCIDGTAKTLAKFAASKTKCYDKCYKNAQKGKVSAAACAPPASDPATQTCVTKAASKAAGGVDKVCFTGTAVAPACYDGGVHPPAVIPSPNTGAGWVSLVELAVDSTVPTTYCGP